jgi:hypothetical protein
MPRRAVLQGVLHVPRGDFLKQSRANEFAFNMGIVMAAVWHSTGMVMAAAQSDLY